MLTVKPVGYLFTHKTFLPQFFSKGLQFFKGFAQ